MAPCWKLGVILFTFAFVTEGFNPIPTLAIPHEATDLIRTGIDATLDILLPGKHPKNQPLPHSGKKKNDAQTTLEKESENPDAPETDKAFVDNRPEEEQDEDHSDETYEYEDSDEDSGEDSDEDSGESTDLSDEESDSSRKKRSPDSQTPIPVIDINSRSDDYLDGVIKGIQMSRDHQNSGGDLLLRLNGTHGDPITLHRGKNALQKKLQSFRKPQGIKKLFSKKRGFG